MPVNIPPWMTLGWLVALVVMILTVLLGAMHQVELTPALLIVAVCAWKL